MVVYHLFQLKHPFGLQGFITDHERALEELFGEYAETSQNCNACINTMATRISTVFASLRVISLALSAFVSIYVCFSKALMQHAYCNLNPTRRRHR